MKITLSYWRVSACSPAQPSCDHRSEFSTQHDRLLTHKQAVFDHLVGRWRDLFNISYDVLL
jgi:hypothetical protein